MFYGLDMSKCLFLFILLQYSAEKIEFLALLNKISIFMKQRSCFCNDLVSPSPKTI